MRYLQGPIGEEVGTIKAKFEEGKTKSGGTKPVKPESPPKVPPQKRKPTGK